MQNERSVGGLLCSDVLARLPAFVEGDLAAAELERVRTHLAGCDLCERFGGEYAGVVQAMRAFLSARATQTSDASALRERVLQTIDREQKTSE